MSSNDQPEYGVCLGYRRIGGYTISMQAAGEWADRVERFIADLQMNPLSYTEKFISPYTVLKYNGIDMKEIGERGNTRLMFVTQYGPYDEYLNMRKQLYEKCGKDNIVKYLLDTNGVTGYKFETVFV